MVSFNSFFFTSISVCFFLSAFWNNFFRDPLESIHLSSKSIHDLSNFVMQSSNCFLRKCSIFICCVSWLSLATPTNPLIESAICCMLSDNPFVISDGSLEPGECFHFIEWAVSTLGPASPSILDHERSCCRTVCNMSYL